MAVLQLTPNDTKPEVEVRKEDIPETKLELMPSSFYANQLSDLAIQRDIATAREAYGNREVVTDAAYSIHEEHAGITPGVSQRYAMTLAETVYQNPLQNDKQIIASVLPNQEDLAKWQPLVNAVGIDYADLFAHKHQTGDIHSYKQIGGEAHMHVDSTGQFYDRNANMITQQEAKQAAFPTIERSTSQEQGLGI